LTKLGGIGHNTNTLTPYKTMLETFIRRKKKKIEELAEKGFLPCDVATAIGLTSAQLAQINTDDEHPFNTIYWTAKIKYVDRLRATVLDLIENGKDEVVKLKAIEYLANEHNVAAENKRLTVGYTNIKKLVSLIRKQKDAKAITLMETGRGCSKALKQNQRQQKAKEIFDGKVE